MVRRGIASLVIMKWNEKHEGRSDAVRRFVSQSSGSSRPRGDRPAGLLNKALDRRLTKAGSVDKVTPAQIEGQYEQIVMYVLPTGSHEHLLD